MMLALLARLKNRSGAELAQPFMEYDPQPPFGPSTRPLATESWPAPLRTPRRSVRPGQAEVTDGPVDGSGERTIAVVLYPGLTALDLVEPVQVLTVFERFAPRYRTVVVGVRTEPMATDLGLRLVPRPDLRRDPHPHIVVVPGGRIGTIRAMSDPDVRRYVRTPPPRRKWSARCAPAR